MIGPLLRIALFVALAHVPCSASAATLSTIKARGHVLCGVGDDLPGFSALSTAGTIEGFEVDYCRGLAAAIFNDPTAMKPVALTARERFQALQSGAIDVLFRKTAWTMARDTTLKLSFTAASYFDGQAFLIRRSIGVASALELSNATVCHQSGTNLETGLRDFFALHKMTITPLAFERAEDAVAAYVGNKCSVLTGEASALYGIRVTLPRPADHVVLPEIISKEPLGAFVRDDDKDWLNLVTWLHFALVNAEELGVTKETATTLRESPKQPVKQLLGAEGDFGHGIGLPADWAYNVIRAIGNYGEVFERNFGVGSRLGAPRGINQLWSKGGLQYAPPIR